MKRLLYLATALFLMTACSKENLTTTTPINEMISTPEAMVQQKGVFRNGPHGTVTGMVEIYNADGKLQLKLDSVMISNGPDLHVYLSREEMPINFIDLGKLKSTSGNQVYDISGMPDFMLYKYALIHCQQYNHLFGSAELK